MSSPEAVPDLYRLAYMPGVFRCPRCNFVQTNITLDLSRGEAGTTESDRETMDCPNDGTRMVNVTWKESFEQCQIRCFAEIGERSKLAQWKSEMLAAQQVQNEVADQLMKVMPPQYLGRNIWEAALDVVVAYAAQSCKACNDCRRAAYSEGNTPGFLHDRCPKHQRVPFTERVSPPIANSK